MGKPVNALVGGRRLPFEGLAGVFAVFGLVVAATGQHDRAQDGDEGERDVELVLFHGAETVAGSRSVRRSRGGRPRRF